MAGNSGNPIDLDLTPGNVKDTVDIFGITGTFTGAGGILPTGPANAIAEMVSGSYRILNAFTQLDTQIGAAVNGTDVYTAIGFQYKEDVGSGPIEHAFFVLKYDTVAGTFTKFEAYNGLFVSSAASPRLYIDGTDILYGDDAGAGNFRRYTFDMSTDTMTTGAVSTGSNQNGSMQPFDESTLRTTASNLTGTGDVSSPTYNLVGGGTISGIDMPDTVLFGGKTYSVAYYVNFLGFSVSGQNIGVQAFMTEV